MSLPCKTLTVFCLVWPVCLSVPAAGQTGAGQTGAAASSRQPPAEDTAQDPVAQQVAADSVMSEFCASCHGADRQEADVRLTALETLDPVDRQALLARVQEVLLARQMPPEDAAQPDASQRTALQQWLHSQLTGDAARALAEKLRRFEYGNVVRHVDLFSGDYADRPGFTFDRRWLISEFIFNERVNRLLDYQATRTIYGVRHAVAGDSGVHWSPKTERGDKFRRTITNPYLLPQAVGVRYSAHSRLTTGHLLTMVGNAKRIAAHMSSENTMRAQYPAMHALMSQELEHRATLQTRRQFLETFGFLDRLLEEIYGSQHAALLPKIAHRQIPYPGPPQHSTSGIQKRQENLEFLGRFDQEDTRAILQGIAACKRTGWEVKEQSDQAQQDRQGKVVWAPYSAQERAEFDRIIRQCETNWSIEGVTDYRIRNRIVTMKLFFDTWDMNRLYQHIRDGRFTAPGYRPLEESEMAILTEAIVQHREPGDTYRQLARRCLDAWEADFAAQPAAAAGATSAQVAAMIDELFRRIFERPPTPTELADSRQQFEGYEGRLGRQQAIAKLIESFVLSTEFAYRSEFGQGPVDEHGRRMMSPRDASYALAYALTDSSPDEGLVLAVAQGRLSKRADYEREVRRMLARRDRWTLIDEGVQAANLNASVTSQPVRKLRFFREFFGYPQAQGVFKDDSRFGAGRHEQAVSRLIDEADMLVEHILEQDERVFETLLTTDRFFAYHSGDNAAMEAASAELRRVWEHFRDLPWQQWEPEDVAPHREFLLTVWEFRKVKGGDNKSLLTTLKRMMAALELHFSDGQASGMPYMKMAMGFWHGGNVLGRTGQQMRGEQVTSYWNIDWKTWNYPTQQPAVIPHRKGLLTHPAWLIAHSQNLETDPIHRGKWIREKLLAGTIPDVPITVDAVIPPDPHRTLRQRMEERTGADYCWRCHQKMDPLGLPFEMYDDFGRFRTEENLEHPDNLITPAKQAPLKWGAKLDVYRTQPVDSRGVLIGTNDPELDGDVVDAHDLIGRLARSERVRQSIIRHAFRYFLGRNETLADSQTLIDADQAYQNSDGSFDEVIVSLLTSDSFLYRKPNVEP